MDTRRDSRDSALKKAGELFGKIGWSKKFADLEEHEVVAIMVVMKEIEGLEDVYTEEYLTELFNKYSPSTREPLYDIPF